MKLKDAIEEFNDYTKITKSEGTYSFYQYYLKMLSSEMGEIDCDDISNRDILSYIKRRQNQNPNVSKATLNKHIITLKAVVKYTTKRKIDFQKLKEQKKIIETVPYETYKKIFDYYQKHISNSYSFRNYLFIRIMKDTGLRLKEMIHININNIDLNTSCIHIKVTKTDVDRFVFFTKQTKELLIKFMITQKIDKYLFFDFKTGKQLTTSSVECFMYRLKKKLNITDKITPHKWRHTFATNFVKSGGNLETLRIILGHTNLKTTQKYLHLSKNDIYEQYQRIME